MNYYEHHLGDYAAATAHLSWDEDMAYTRLIRAYYHHERPIPADLREACRLARATTPAQRRAVDTVLHEFFALHEDGWHQKRCDEEIERYQTKQPEAEAKKANDRERQRRARERRKQLFDDLRSHGIVAPWDATTEHLQDALSRATTRDGHAGSHAPVTHPVTRDNTATQTPDTRQKTSEAKASGVPPPVPIADPPDPVKAIFDLGVSVLTATGSTEKAARSLVAKARKELGDDGAMAALVAAKSKTNPAEYLGAAIKPDPVADSIRQRMGGARVEKLDGGGYRCAGRYFNADGSGRVALC